MADLLESNPIEPAVPPPAVPVLHTHKPNGVIPTIVADVVSGVSSLLVGGVTAWGLINQRAYKNLSSLHYFEGMKDERRAAGENLIGRVNAGKISPATAGKETEGLIGRFDKKASDIMKAAGAGSMLEKWRKLRPHQQAEVAITALAAGGIALGSVLVLTRGLFNNQQQQELAEKGSNEGPQR